MVRGWTLVRTWGGRSILPEATMKFSAQRGYLPVVQRERRTQAASVQGMPPVGTRTAVNAALVGVANASSFG